MTFLLIICGIRYGVFSTRTFYLCYKYRKKPFVSETFIMSQDCFFNSKDGKKFDSSRGLSGLVRLSECNDEVKHHLISCHLSKEVLSENELILARTGLFHLTQEDKEKMWICYRYRHTLGKFWRICRWKYVQCCLVDNQ